MKQLHKALLTFLFLFLFPTIGIATTTLDPYANIKYYELDNGLKVFMLSDKLSKNIQIDVSVKVGRDVEDKANAGITHLVEHIIFRDQRVPHKDYIDYIEEEGATYVNGSTSRYETHYVTTISSDKAYWIVETFAQMLFDKVVTEEDLVIEKKALQVEIWELYWYDKLDYMLASYDSLLPSFSDAYVDEFSLKEIEPRIHDYFYKKNNKEFTLDEVMSYYNEYYYPENMTLKIVGNFDDAKMKEAIVKSFGVSKRVGTKKVEEPIHNAKLNNKPHIYYGFGQSKDYAEIGTKYILDDYKKYLIIDSYTDYLATNMQQLLRNKLGQTYGVNSFYESDRDAVATGVKFDSLHAEFYRSIELVKEKIDKDVTKIDSSDIKEALKQSALYYSSLEHNSKTLLSLVNTQEYIQKYHPSLNETDYAIFNSITHEEFQDTISEAFAPQNRYESIYELYYLFPLELPLSYLLIFIILLYVLNKIEKFIYLKKGFTAYSLRDVAFSRRLSNRFLQFLQFIFIVLIALYINAWSEYWFFQVIFDNAYYVRTIKSPYNLLCDLASFTYYIVIVMIIDNYIFKKSFSRIDATEGGLFFTSSFVVYGFGSWDIGAIFIAKDELKQISITPWSLGKFSKIYGIAMLFFKPLVMLSLKDGSVLYIRSNNAKLLEKELREWLSS